MTLTKTQKEIIRLMREGWEIGTSGGINSTAWLQKGGIGRGGESKNCHLNTWYSLCQKRFIIKSERAAGGLTTIYTLTDKGRTVNID